LVTVQKRVDPSHVAVNLLPGISRHPINSALRRPAETDGSQKPILCHSRPSENLGKTPVTDPSLELHLP
jgi:hypothetical protein